MEKKIFVIDDDPLVSRMIATALEAEGHAVLTFETFGALLQAIQRELPDLVMVDVVMPEISGFEICRKIKEIRPHPPRVIMMTGKLDAVDPVRARGMGADDFVVKTSDMAVLIQAVQGIFPT